MTKAKDFMLRVHHKKYKGNTYEELLIHLPSKIKEQLDPKVWKKGTRISIMTDGHKIEIVPIPWKNEA